MAVVRTLLEHHLEFSPGTSLEAFFTALPARWAVALLRDENQSPLQMISVRDLRNALRARLSEAQTGKRVNWREVVRSIQWQPVDSEFEADWIYLQVAAEFFPGLYDLVLRKNQAWFLHVDPNAEFPRYVKTINPRTENGRVVGPILDKHAAARLIELIEDAFDLCRYYNILVQAPGGKACAYKEMGKCPAPCDGSISIEQYRRLIDYSLRALTEPAHFIEEQTRRMEAAAAELRFETAAQIRAYIDHLRQLSHGAFRFARPLSDFQFVTLQAGPGKQNVKIFLVSLGRIEPIASLRGEPFGWQELLHTILTRADELHNKPVNDHAANQIGLIVHHLFSSKRKAGSWIPLAELNESTLSAAYRVLSRNRARPVDKSQKGLQMPGVEIDHA